MKLSKDGMLVRLNDIEADQAIAILQESGFKYHEQDESLWSPTEDREMMKKVGKDEFVMNPSLVDYVIGVSNAIHVRRGMQTGVYDSSIHEGVK